MTIFKTGLGALTAAALVCTAAMPAHAGSSQSNAVSVGTSGATDISAQRRHRGGGGGAAAAAAFAGIVGTAIAVGAARNSYDDGYGYYDAGPRYYGSPYDSYNSYGGGGYYGGSNYQSTSPGYGWDDPRNHNTSR